MQKEKKRSETTEGNAEREETEGNAGGEEGGTHKDTGVKSSEITEGNAEREETKTRGEEKRYKS